MSIAAGAFPEGDFTHHKFVRVSENFSCNARLTIGWRYVVIKYKHTVLISAPVYIEASARAGAKYADTYIIYTINYEQNLHKIICIYTKS